MTRILSFALLSAVLAAPAFAADPQLHLNFLTCKRKTAPAQPRTQGWGEMKELQFFAQVTEGPKPEGELNGLVNIEFYPERGHESEELRALFSYTLKGEKGKPGLKGTITLPSIFGGDEQDAVEIPKFTIDGDNPAELDATVTSSTDQKIELTCKANLQH